MAAEVLQTAARRAGLADAAAGQTSLWQFDRVVRPARGGPGRSRSSNGRRPSRWTGNEETAVLTLGRRQFATTSC